jgi:superfamily I DNA/RNA helicase
VLLDEAQDLGTTALQFAVNLLKPGCEDLVIVADAAQNIFRRRFSWRQAGIQAQGRTRILRVNYRNTREILEFASRFLLASRTLRPEEVPDPEDEQAIIPPESAARSGSAPEVRIAPHLDAELQAAVEVIRGALHQRSAPRTAAVLYASQYDGGRERAGALYERLRQHRVDVFWATDPSDRTARDRIAEASEPVILSTIHSAKGLEFPIVALCGLWRDDQDLESNRKLAYVGMTRATDRLVVIARDHTPLLGDLNAAAEGSSRG